MSAANVEIVRRVYDAVARSDTATVLGFYHPDVEWDAARTPVGDVMGPGVYRGHEGLRRWFREWYEAWENVEDDCEELIDAGSGRVISVTTVRARGRTSGVVIEQRRAAIWTISDRKVVHVVWFPTGEEALEAAGLSE
jgi:ketosteroid isomerase-like protein